MNIEDTDVMKADKGKTVKVESKVQPRGIPACSSRATS